MGDEELKEDDLQKEITRAKAISNLAAQIINNGSLVLKAQEFLNEHGLIEGKRADRGRKFPPMLRAEFLRE